MRRVFFSLVAGGFLSLLAGCHWAGICDCDIPGGCSCASCYPYHPYLDRVPYSNGQAGGVQYGNGMPVDGTPLPPTVIQGPMNGKVPEPKVLERGPAPKVLDKN